MFSTLKFSNFSVNIVCVAGVFFSPLVCFFSCGKVRDSAAFCFDLGSAFERL